MTLIDELREDLYELLNEDPRSICKICDAAGVDESSLYLFLNKSRHNIYATKLLALANAMGYHVTFRRFGDELQQDA